MAGATIRDRMRQETIDWAMEKFGPHTVLLPVPGGRKGCFQRGFTKLTAACTADPHHLAELRRHGNLGVALGRQSDGLASIDIDLEEEVERFLALNPKLRESLRSSAKRGCNLWVRIAGEAPRSAALKLDDGTPWGEWRYSGNLTMIAGIHPSGLPYRVLDPAAPVVTIQFAEIVWPENLAPIRPPRRAPPHPGSSFPLPSTSYPLPSTDLPSTGLHTTPKKEKAMAAPTERLKILYDRYVLPEVLPRAGGRNAAIVELAPKLAYAVSQDTAIELLMMLFDIHHAIWKDDRERHEYEVRHLVRATVESFEAALTLSERGCYAPLPQPYLKEVFRIGKSLAMCSGQNSPPPPDFFLSSDELARRIGESSQTCGNILHRFCRWGILELVTPGVKRAKGVPGKAAYYRWNLA